MLAVAAKFQMQDLAPAVSSVLDCWSSGVLEYWSNGPEISTLQHSITPSLQILGQHQLGAARFVDVIDPIKRVANQVKTDPARFDQVMRPSFHFVRKNFFAVIAQPQAHPFA